MTEVFVKHALSTALLAALFVSAMPATAAPGGFQINEQGARAMAQAGAFAARANDPSALYFNPAGISFLYGTQIMLGATIISPRYTFFGPYNSNSNREWEMNAGLFYPANLYVTHAFSGGALQGFAVGLGVNTPYGLGTAWPDDWAGKAITRKAELQTLYAAPTIAYRFAGLLAIGVGVNIAYGTVDLRRAVTNFDPEMDLELEGSGIGISWNAGVMVKPSDDISLGISYRAATEIEYSGTANFHPPASLAGQFPGGDVATTVTNPATWFAGIAWRASDDLEVEFDYQGIGWSSYDELAVDFARDEVNEAGVLQSDIAQAKNYEDTYILRLGAEYNLGALGMKVRGGYIYDNNPVPDNHLEPLLPDSDRHGLTFGVGMTVYPGLTLDAAYMHLFFMDRETTATSFEGGVYFDGMYSGSVDLFGVNLTYVLH